MSRYHVRVVPSNGKPDLYLSRTYNDFHDGPFTPEFKSRMTFARPNGADRRIAIEVDRLPNRYFGDLTFEVVEEADESTCTRCEKPVRNVAYSNGLARWVDEDGNQICDWGGGDERHEPA
jgi:hypothetical protein